MRLTLLAGLALAPFAFGQASFQISSLSVSMSVSTTATQAILQYSSPTEEACSLRAADMNRRINISAATQSQGTVTVTTKGAHGLLTGSAIYIEGSGIEGWNGWQVVSAVGGANRFTFASATAGSTATGNVGVLVDDLNPGLFPGANLDSRTGNPNSGRRRVFVLGRKSADIASDGNRYSRALQVNSRHRFTLTCGSQNYDQEFTTQNLPLGDTHNGGPPLDRSNPGQYAYPTVQWANRAQSLIDPATGVRSVRGTGPAGTASTAKNFQTAIDSSGQWSTPSGPLSPGGTAAFTGPCQSGNCALFLRADDLTLSGGATYKTGYGEGSSLDWATVTLSGASISNSECAASSQQPGSDACRIAACLTVNGVTCSTAEREATLTNKPASYTLGSRTAMDLWQKSGAPGIARPDVSKSSGTANYTDGSRRLTWVSGDKFSIKWTPGSRILVAGSEYRIESVQSELSLTLAAPGPVGNLQQAPYSANNFGVLIRKKTSNTDKLTVGYTTYQYGSSPMPVWPSTSVPNCSETSVAAGKLEGYNCFIGRELYWISKDGSDVRDLGFVGMSERYGEDKNLLWSTSATCGSSGLYSQFDPLDADTWYCLVLYKPWTKVQTQAILKAHYEGDHSERTPAGVSLPDCDLNKGARPCVRFTPMQPRYEDGVTTAGFAFNPEFATSGYAAAIFGWGGVTKEGDILIMTREAGGQDTKGWQFVFTLGDRTPAGTGPNSLRPIAAASSYRHAPLTWCSIHTTSTPEDGWARFANNDFSYPRGPNAVYGMILTSALLTSAKGGAGGLNYCPDNPLGASGQKCTEITVSSEPRLGLDGSYLQDTQVGDLIRIDSEYMRIVKKTDSTHLTVERGYLTTAAAAHAGSNLSMACGIRNWLGSHEAAWNYRADPYGRNADWSTIRIDHANVGGHLGEGGGVRVNAAANWYRVGEALCPSALLTKGGFCYQVRRGSLAEAMTQPTLGVADDPPFGGAIGFGNPNQVDSHPGPCTNQWCLDGRPMIGGASDGAASAAGSASSPGINVSGQLWKFAGAGNNLKRKTLATMAYAGRFPLVDVSGPASRLPSDATGAYRYCVALKAGECAAGSAAGDVYVNAPFVSKAYCDYPGIAVQSDETNSICIAPLGAYTGTMVQFGTTRQDATGATSRRLGSMFARWNQHGVFWNASMTTSGDLLFSQVRWLDGIRHEDIVTVLPPYPASDSIARNTFIPIEVKIPPQGGAGTRAVVEFGYGENGDEGQFYCTSRQETCVAVSRDLNQDSPFYFAQSETYSGVSCASGCTVTVPALSQRVLYYRWKQRNALGQITGVSETRAVVTP